MKVLKYIEDIGQYFLMLGQVLRRPQRFKIFWEALMRDVEELGIKSIGIIAFISFFIGGVIALQTALNTTNPNTMVPKMLIGFATKRSMILEFAPTFCSIILAGKVGSYITSSIGTMRVTEQIDALEIMGVNSLNYLVLPKVIATLFFYPFLIILAMFLGMYGGWVAGQLTGIFHEVDYITGLQIDFDPYLIFYALMKTLVFSFLIATIPSFHGYYVKGGSLEVGKASTRSVVWTTVVIVITNYILTQVLLT